jgi:thioredoxin reductase (NADPH)
MHELIIIGAGPAGLTAGIYAGRYRMDTVILEKLGVGGQIILSEIIENFPGFPQPIATMELMERFKKQLDNSGVPILEGEVTDIQAARDGSYLINSSGGTYDTKSVIVASGASPRRLGIPGEEEFTGRGVA